MTVARGDRTGSPDRREGFRPAPVHQLQPMLLPPSAAAAAAAAELGAETGQWCCGQL